MTTLRDRIRLQTGRFEQALPALLPIHGGKWVVFRDGVQSVHDDEESAYARAVEAFGVEGGFVVARVAETHPVPITAAVMFANF